jgi:hypothetical protein
MGVAEATLIVTSFLTLYEVIFKPLSELIRRGKAFFVQREVTDGKAILIQVREAPPIPIFGLTAYLERKNGETSDRRSCPNWAGKNVKFHSSCFPDDWSDWDNLVVEYNRHSWLDKIPWIGCRKFNLENIQEIEHTLEDIQLNGPELATL